MNRDEVMRRIKEQMIKKMESDLHAVMGARMPDMTPEDKEAHRRVDDLEAWLRIKDGIKRFNTNESRLEFVRNVWDHPEQYVMYMNADTALGIRQYLAEKGMLQYAPQIVENSYMDDGEVIFARTGE